MYKQFLPLKAQEIKKIWEDGIIVLDTNILLHLYRYDELLRQKLLNILDDKNIKEKIWIPYKVYEEFLRNRPAVICEQWDIEQKVTSIISKGLDDLNDNIKKQLSKKFHPYIYKEIFNAEIEALADKLKNNIKVEKEKRYNLELNNDNILDTIQNLIEKKVGKEFSAEELEKIYEEGKDRFSNKIPPGFEDEKEKNPPDCYSDLVIWKSIIEKSKEKHDIIFVTDDRKEDWWRIEKGRTIGPLPQLIEEFIQETNKNIIFYDSMRFYNYVDEYIADQKVKLTEEENKQLETISIEDFFEQYKEERSTPVRKVKIVKRKRPKKKYSKEEILEWFWDNYEDPANGVSYISKEGGYQYYFGGPYDPNEEIQDNFPDIDMDTLNSVLDEIYPYGTEWVKKGEY